jgi:hypothetical protein
VAVVFCEIDLIEVAESPVLTLCSPMLTHVHPPSSREHRAASLTRQIRVRSGRIFITLALGLRSLIDDVPVFS